MNNNLKKILFNIILVLLIFILIIKLFNLNNNYEKFLIKNTNNNKKVFNKKVFNKKVFNKKEKSNNIKKYEKMAVMVEPRKHKNIVPVVLNVIKNLNEDWYIKIFHGKSAYDFIYNSELKPYIDNGKILLQALDVDNLNAFTYSDLLKTNKFWDDCLGEYILIFQTDSVICGNSNFKIEDFFHLDYVGGSWRLFHQAPKLFKNNYGGNGGFSFRKASAMKEVIKKFPPMKTDREDFDKNEFNKNTTNIQEDIYFIFGLTKLGSKSSEQDVFNFSTQFDFKAKSLGTHQFYNFLSKNDKQKFLDYCPEANILL